eukprot:jgi/Tetstr1/427745/TSEL_017867.t2
MNSSLPVLGMLHPLGAARLLAGLLLLAAAAGQSDLPLPRRCHLAAPCTATRGCEPLVGGREAWVAGGEGVEVQLGVVCIAQGGSRLYGTAAFFTYEIRAPGSQQLLQQGKFNQYDLGLHAHVSNTLRLPLGEYSLTVLQGALESDRTSIATGQPYTLHAVPTPPPAPVEVANSPSGSGVAAAPDAGADDATPLDVTSPVIREGSLGGEGEQALDEGAVPPPPTGRPRAPDTQAAAQPAAGGDDMVVIIVVAVVALLALSVFGVGLFVYLRGGGPGALTRFSDPASGAPSPDKRASAYTSYGGADADDTSTDPEAGGSKAIIVHAQHREQTPIGLPQMKPNTAEAELMAAEGGLLTPPDFSGVSGPRRPARGKRAKQEGEEEGAQDAIIDGPESRGLIFGSETEKPPVVAFGELMKLTETLFSSGSVSENAFSSSQDTSRATSAAVRFKSRGVSPLLGCPPLPPP